MSGRVLVTTWGWHSHLSPMLPLARGLRAAGCAVTLATPPSMAGAARSSGLPSVVVGRDIDALPAFRSFVIQHSPPPPAAAPGAPPRAGPPRALQVFRDAASAMVDDLIAAGSSREADLIVFEPTALAGPLAAAALAVPAVRHLCGPDLMWRARPWLADLLGPAASRLGLPEPPDPFGALTIDPVPQALAAPDEHPGARLPVRYGARPRPPRAGGQRPVVVTWGTTMGMLDERLMLAVRYAESLAGGSYPVVVALPPGAGRPRGAGPAPVSVVDPADLRDVLADAAAVVSQGGARTVLSGLAAGVPQVVVGQLPDHLAIGRRVAAAGAGIVLTPAEASGEAVRMAVAAVLGERGYRESARAIATENDSRPDPAALAAPLCRLLKGEPVESDGHIVGRPHPLLPDGPARAGAAVGRPRGTGRNAAVAGARGPELRTPGGRH